MRPSILKQGEFLIVSVQSALTDAELLELPGHLAMTAGKYRSRGVIIDVTALDVMDSFACRTLRTIVQVLKLRGAETVVVGIQPEVAFSIVRLGLSLENVVTALNLEDGLSYLQQQFGKGDDHGG